MTQLLGTVTIFDEPVKVLKTTYASGAPAIVLTGLGDEPWGHLTANLPEVVLGDKEICVKTWSENALLLQPLLDSGIFQDTGRRVELEFVEAAIWQEVTRH